MPIHTLPAYRGQKARKRVAGDKSKLKLEAFIVQFQAGENKLSNRICVWCVIHWFNCSSPSVCRGYLAKQKYKELLDEKNKAATKIQARYRGHKERKSFQRKKYEARNFHNLALKNKSGLLFLIKLCRFLFVGK